MKSWLRNLSFRSKLLFAVGMVLVGSVASSAMAIRQLSLMHAQTSRAAASVMASLDAADPKSGTAEFKAAAPKDFVLVALDFPNGEEAKAKVPNPQPPRRGDRATSLECRSKPLHNHSTVSSSR